MVSTFWLIDTSIFSNFAKCDAVDLVRDQFGKTLRATSYVKTEITRGIQTNRIPKVPHGWLRAMTLRYPEERNLFRNLSRRLGKGEASSIAIAYHRKYSFLTDDKDARVVAQSLQIPVSGTIGLLVKLVQKKACTEHEAERLLHSMIEHGFYSPISSMKELTSP